MRPLLLDAAARANRYLENLATRNVAPSAEDTKRLPDLGGPLPQKSGGPRSRARGAR